MFFVVMLLLTASAFVSNSDVEDNVKVGVNIIVILIFVIMIVSSIL